MPRSPSSSPSSSELKADGVGIVYISHKMDEMKRIADRVTVMRDGEYVGTRAGRRDADRHDHLDDGRPRADRRDARRCPTCQRDEVVLEVDGLNRGSDIRDVSFSLRKGEILGFAGLMGAGRTEVARAIFGADPIDGGEIQCTASR